MGGILDRILEDTVLASALGTFPTGAPHGIYPLDDVIMDPALAKAIDSIPVGRIRPFEDRTRPTGPGRQLMSVTKPTTLDSDTFLDDLASVALDRYSNLIKLEDINASMSAGVNSMGLVKIVYSLSKDGSFCVNAYIVGSVGSKDFGPNTSTGSMVPLRSVRAFSTVYEELLNGAKVKYLKSTAEDARYVTYSVGGQLDLFVYVKRATERLCKHMKRL